MRASRFLCSSFSSSNLDMMKSPEGIVAELNRHIIGQSEAKKCLAVALRDRWRRYRIEDAELRKEITPNNILLIGPSGCGKTELAKRLAAFSGAPFIKVVATKYTEVGIVGDDTASIIQDLVDQALADEKRIMKAEVASEALERVMDQLTIAVRKTSVAEGWTEDAVRGHLKEGKFDHLEVEIDAELLAKDDVPKSPFASLFGSLPAGIGKGASIMATAIPMHLPTSGGNSENLMELLGVSRKGKTRGIDKKKLTVKDASPILRDYYSNQLIDADNLNERGRTAAEQRGIVFIDEFDKLIDSKTHEPQSSVRGIRKGVQKEFLTLLEGATVSTNIGRVETDHVLFIASGAFTSSKPSDIMPELLGRLPIRCELQPLVEADFLRILKDTQYNLLMQQQALLRSEGVSLQFTDEAVEMIAKVSHSLNVETANVGARRLKTVITKLLEDVKFEADLMEGQEYTVTKEMVESKLAPLLQKSDLSKYIL